jgi:hypothetical protein
MQVVLRPPVSGHPYQATRIRPPARGGPTIHEVFVSLERLCAYSRATSCGWPGDTTEIGFPDRLLRVAWGHDGDRVPRPPLAGGLGTRSLSGRNEDMHPIVLCLATAICYNYAAVSMGSVLHSGRDGTGCLNEQKGTRPCSEVEWRGVGANRWASECLRNCIVKRRR